jgi:chain length determinant protein (polysaccharide antigen chain regulator)
MSALQSIAHQAMPSTNSDEIDLFEVCQGLWQQKWLIASTTALASVLAAAVAFTATPVYEASASILPPQQSSTSNFNLGLAEAGVNSFDVVGVYTLVKRIALSDELRREAFEKLYLPHFDGQDKKVNRQALWADFNKKFTVNQSPDKSRPELYMLSIQGEDAALTASLVNDVMQMVASKTKAQMQANVDSEVTVKLNTAKQTISVMQAAAQKSREDRIVRLREALQVAEAVGLESPRVTAGKTSTDGELAEFVDGNLMYMRGAKAIRAELNVLESRKNNDPFIAELPALRNQIDFLERINFQPANAAVFTVDNIPEAPVQPIKPKKSLILVLGILLGGMLGVFAALIRLVLIKRAVKV